jgi:hypothetical protein
MIAGTSSLRHIAVLSLVLMIGLDTVGASPIYVDATATGANDGTSWMDAYVDLQDAIAQAWNNPSSYPEIRVAQGRYTPDSGSLDRFAVFHLVNNVEIKGGYGGLQAADPDDRDIFRYESILRGDLVVFMAVYRQDTTKNCRLGFLQSMNDPYTPKSASVAGQRGRQQERHPR